MILKTIKMQKTKESEYYENIHQATLYSFKGVIDNNDYRYLLKEWQEDISNELEDKLADAWYNIYNEYSEIIGDSSASLQFVEMRRQTVKKHKIAYLSKLLQFITICKDEEIIETLKEDGINIDTEDFDNSFRAAIGKLSKMRLQLKRSEDEVIEEKNSIELLITELEKFQGYQFDEDKMKVKKFAYIVKRYKDGRQDNKR